MRKFVRLAIGLAVAASILALPVVSTPVSQPTAVAVAHNSSAALNCNPVQNIAFHTTRAGNLYAIDVNTCVGKYADLGSSWVTEGMVRYTCWRNADPWDGCRLVGNVEHQAALEGGYSWTVDVSTPFSAPGSGWPCSPGENCWFQNSGRISSAHVVETDQEWCRAKSEPTAARFRLADGTNVLTSTVEHTYSLHGPCFN